MTQYGAIQVTPTNLELMTEKEALGVHQNFKQVLNQADYPINIYSLQRDLELQPYAEYLKDRFSIRRELWEDYLRYCSRLNDESLVATEHYITTPVTASDRSFLASVLDSESSEDLESEVQRRTQQITDSLNTANLSATEIPAEELETSPSNPTPRYVSTGQEYRRALIITEYPSQLELAWPLELLRVDGKIDVAQLIKPRDSANTVSTLNRLKEKLNAEINSRLASGFLDTNELESKLDAVDWMLDKLANREQQAFDYAVYISAHADNKEDCDQAFEQVKSRLKRIGIGFEEPVFRTDQAQKACNPLQLDPLQETQLQLSDSTAAGFPFATRTINQSSGIIYGEDQYDGTPILQDRFQWHAPHLARFGATGSGKTFHTKIELLRAILAYPDIQVIVIDPKNEYHNLIKALNGETYTVQDRPEDLGKASCFQVPSRGQSDNIPEIIDLIEHLYQVTSQNDRRTLVVADEAHNVSGVGRGREILTRWVREARDTSTAITLVSQSANDFTQYTEGRTLLDQLPGKLFFRHERVSQEMIDHFQLSEQEEIDLYDLKTGTDAPYSEAVMKVSGRLDAKIRVHATPAEHRLIEQ